MKIFLTGATGFIGSHFLNLAIQNNHEVIALKRSPDSVPRITLEREPLWLKKEMGQVTIDDLEGVDVLVHLAAHSANIPYDSLEKCIKYNVVEPLSLFNTAHKAGVSKFVVAGSCFEYGLSGERYDFIPPYAPLEPTQTYPASKAMASIAFRQFAIEKKISLFYYRIFQVFGEGELSSRLWPSLRNAALLGIDFPMTKGEQVRDFINISDVASKLFDLSEEIVSINSLLIKFGNLGCGKPQTVREFSDYWWEKWNAKGNILYGEKEYRKGEIMRYVPFLDS